MLVLSRKLGESVVLNDTVTATVAVIGRDFADLRLDSIGSQTRLGIVSIGLREMTPVIRGISAVAAQIQQDKVRLGFESEPGHRVERRESWIP
jgi:sRNA-binding carbon storage regulator CsrA